MSIWKVDSTFLMDKDKIFRIIFQVIVHIGFVGESELFIHLQCRRLGFDLWVGKIIPWRRAWQLTPVFLPGESPWREEPSRLQKESQRVRYNWVTKHSTAQHYIVWKLIYLHLCNRKNIFTYFSVMFKEYKEICTNHIRFKRTQYKMNHHLDFTIEWGICLGDCYNELSSFSCFDGKIEKLYCIFFTTNGLWNTLHIFK